MPGDDFPEIRYLGKGRRYKKTVMAEVNTTVFMLRESNPEPNWVPVAERNPKAVVAAIHYSPDICGDVYAFYFSDTVSAGVKIDGRRVLLTKHKINESCLYWPFGEEISMPDAEERFGVGSPELHDVTFFNARGYRAVLARDGIVRQLSGGDIILDH